MPQPFDLSDVIQDAVDDARVDTIEDSGATEVDSSDVGDSQLEASPEAVEASPDAAVEPEVVEAETSEVASPGALQTPDGAQFQMDKKLGIPSHTNGRENRIPYSRVKKIVEKAEKEALAPYHKQIAELTPKIQDYESRLNQVAQFEHVLVNEPQKFMEMLSTIPAYQGFFSAINELQQRAVGQAQQQTQTVDNDPMPGPDDAESGTYTLQGLQTLLEWQSRQVESRVTKQVEDRYAPIRQEWDANRRLQELAPVVQAQIDDARKWPQFNENEPAIVDYLNRFPASKLEEAYRVVVLPKLQADRNSMRQQLLNEIQKAPKSTSAPAQASRPVTQTHQGARSLEDVIAEQARSAGLIR